MKPEQYDLDRELGQWTASLDGNTETGGRLIVPDDVQPVGPMAGPWHFCLMSIGTVALVAAVLIGGLGVRGLRVMTAGQIAAFLIVGVMVLPAAARLFYQEWKPASRVLVPFIGLIAMVGAGVGGFLSLGFEWRPDWPHFLSSGAVCLSIGTFSSLAAGLLLARLTRTGFAVNQGHASWAVGLVATLTGWIVLQIYCPKQEMAHLATWHGAALLAGATVAAALTRFRFRQQA